MELLNALGLALLGKELVGQTERLSRLVLRRAVLRVRFDLRDRYADEWGAHLLDCPGPFSQLWHAIQCFICAPRVSFDEITLIEYALFSTIGLVILLARLLLVLWRIKIRICYTLAHRLILLECSPRNVRRIKTATSRAVKLSRVLKGAVIFGTICFEAGCRLGKQKNSTDSSRLRTIALSLSLTAYYIKRSVDERRASYIFRESLGLSINIGEAEFDPKFVELAKQGEKMRIVLTELRRHCITIDALLLSMRSNANAGNVTQIDTLRQKIGVFI